MDSKKTLITLHGGCFVGGSATWDAKQTECLKNMNYDVHQLEFPKDNFEETIDYIVTYIEKLNRKVYLLGRSSGGYLAKVVFDTRPDLIEKVVYLAPVFNPKLRGETNKRFKDKQDYYFRMVKKLPATDSFDVSRELLFLASKDENVPRKCFTERQVKNAYFLGIETHKGLLETTSERFRKHIKNHFH